MKQTRSIGGIVINKKGYILVVNQNGISWSLPKGHAEKGEDLIGTAKREIYEESGISNLDFIKELGSYKRYKISLNGSEDKSELKTIIIFLFKTEQDILSPIDQRNPEALWIEKEKVVGLLTHKKDKEFFLSVIDKI
ncbi:MAG: hypothetical protein A2909_01415 [Candidatus Tagabacteria bacterium RIFCSPLOWO2_01_FULL_39_11]|uniref:Nudix hydrolase domain-containing protein n=1 Tax=Candidatus Tagabacteria bacterium RIFCSPLOWO2_01_FULL_39_11 TaxID=1802295 RepID=A0A1G2LQN5_9BACT|nr:MAG: hypothetical protein A2909_01415 [Candidatus Tagabacteria bacterium RIFCSPLOWO2_01_FULL_39_11]